MTPTILFHLISLTGVVLGLSRTGFDNGNDSNNDNGVMTLSVGNGCSEPFRTSHEITSAFCVLQLFIAELTYGV